MPDHIKTVTFQLPAGETEPVIQSPCPTTWMEALPDKAAIRLSGQFDKIQDLIEQTRQTQTSAHAPLTDKSGTKWMVTTHFDTGSGNISGLIISLVAEQELEQLRGIVDLLPVALWYKDDSNKVLRVNKTAADVTGLRIEQIEGRQTEEVHPDMAAAYLADDLEIIRSGTAKRGYLEKFTPINKPPIWHRTDKIPFTDPATGKKGVLAAAIDVTDTVNLQKEYEALNRRFKEASNASGLGLWEYLLDGSNDVWWSDGMYKIFDHDPDTKTPFMERFKNVHPDDMPQLAKSLRAAIEDSENIAVAYRIQRMDKRWQWVEIKGSPECDETGKVIGLTGSLRDITAQKTTERNLREQMKKLEWANERLDSFTHIAAHDLKSPMRGMVNLVNWIEEDLPESALTSVASWLDMLKSRIKRLETLLEDLGNYTRAGQENRQPSIIDFKTFLPRLVDLLDSKKDIKMELHTDLPILELPTSAAHHMFLNVLSNAAKHVQEDQITFHVASRDMVDSVEITLEDSGPGIPPEYRNRVFEPFKTLQSRDNVEGSGIGLSIVRRLVDDIGGEVKFVDPTYGNGAAISFTFPKTLVVG